jgi:AraC family L-rhamnose operon regulatory protein RhaS
MRRASSSIRGIEFYGQWKSGKKLHRLPRHKNPGLEIVLVSKGELRWEVEGREVTLGADMLFYTLPWQAHGGVEELQPSTEISYFCVKLAEDYARPWRRFGFHPAFAFLPEEERVISSAFARSSVQALPAHDSDRWLFRLFFEVARGPGSLRRSRVRDIVKLLIFDLAGRMELEGSSPPRLREAERRVRKFAEELGARHAEPWTLESMSEASRLGRTQFAQLLKKQFGDTPVTYLNRIRVREAQKLIRESNKSITEIAFEVGFNSSQYFATVFKEFTDLEARAYRDSLRGKAGKARS